MKPAPSLRSELRLARHIINWVATADELPAVADLPATLLEVGGRLRESGDLPRKLHRTAIARAACTFGLAYCWDYLPDGWTYASAEVRSAASKLTGSARSRQAQHPLDPRISWWTPDGRLVIDEIHGTHLGDGLLDDWMRARISGDLAVGAALAGDAFAGVRLCSLRAVNVSALVTDLTDRPSPLADTDLWEGGLLR